MKYTIEKATQSLSFSDVEIKILESGVESLVRRKPFHVELLLYFNDTCPNSKIRFLIVCVCCIELNKFCSDVILHNKEVKIYGVGFYLMDVRSISLMLS